MVLAQRAGRHALLRHARSVKVRAASSASVPPLVNDPFGAVTPDRGFLPSHDPPPRLSHEAFDAWEDALAQLPKLSVVAGSGALRRTLEQLPPFQAELLLGQWAALPPPAADTIMACGDAARGATCGHAPSSACGQAGQEPLDGAQLWRAYLLLSALSHAYMWCDGPDTPQVLPARLAVPWVAVSCALGMPPVSVYATYNLLNWRRLDPAGAIELGNIVCLYNYNGGMDEEWFRLVHVNIEAAAAPALAALAPLQASVQQEDAAGIEAGLQQVAASLVQMQALLERMGERCDPQIYYKRVRQPMAGWRGNSALPHGLTYEGVWQQPVQLYGETGAQSSIVPAFDAVLGVRHEAGWLSDYLGTMRQHMPPAHRAFLAALEARPSARTAAQRGPASLCSAYDEAVAQLAAFRAQHRGFAASYIARWSAKERGTGGSDFMPALAAYTRSTKQRALQQQQPQQQHDHEQQE